MISLILFNRPRELQTFYDIGKDSNANPNPEIFSGLDFKKANYNYVVQYIFF